MNFYLSSSGLSLAVQRFSQSLQEFQFECIGDAETDDEVNIGETEMPLFTQACTIFKICKAFYSSGMCYLFCSPVFKGVLSALKHHGRGEKTSGKKMCDCI